ncbi:hypothetical protein GDO86_002217 [Hymenochirus boettgeri]|uniref:Uncharacterized protein n=1 Tax=Hymenochirus boettgeri TaxID=247094 RepID=A0A8T2KLM4_9PIPI|nr:hypothetical protein GDO86_002217 [Hymenochirus boettgeri]KAG8456349.1 hypothetical protein GDO86_002217 [Hymenochirus boettgeri]KAG8456350.1 hypothetical protein GDO86_002217 [Hymenochirus boettgeri]
MSSAHSNVLESPQAGKPLHRSSGSYHKSFHPINQENSLLSEGPLNKFTSHTPMKKIAGNQQKVEKLQEENDKLKQEIEEVRNQYKQLVEESKNECFDERRVKLLKAQVIQLERQVMLLTEGLNSRASLLLEVDNTLQPIVDRLRCLVASEKQSPDVPVSRAELIRMIEICQVVQDKLHRNHQGTNVENLALPWILYEKQVTKDTVTLIDLCFGKMENLNLLYVSALEEKLCRLYRHLNATKDILGLILTAGTESPDTAYHILPNVMYARLMNQITGCCEYVEECCRDLLKMTLIVPSAPWAELDSAVNQEFTVDNVLAVMPALPKGAPQQRAKRAAEALVKAANYSRLMAMQQIHALEAELDFHRSIYSLQIQYIEAVFQGIKKAYHNFQENVASVVCSPLKEILTSYTDLKKEASETCLKNFLTNFKSNVEELQDAVDILTPSTRQQHEGDEALSKLGKEFFLSLEHSLKTCGEQRDKAAWEIENLKNELEQSLESMNNLKKGCKERGSLSKNYSIKLLAGANKEGHSLCEEKSQAHTSDFDQMQKNFYPLTSNKEKDIVKRAPVHKLQTSGKDNNQRSKSVKYPPKPLWQD